MELDEAVALARHLMDLHGLTDWVVVLDNAKTRAGVCRTSARQIGLSRPLTQLHADDEVRDTVLHEIAHALVGSEHGHDTVWRAKALELGCSGRRCLISINGQLPAPWRGVCPAGHVAIRFRRPERAQSCGQCSPRFDATVLIEWTYRGEPVEMNRAYQAEVAAIQARAVPGQVAAAAAATLQSVAAAARPSLPVGTPVWILGTGPYGGLVGRVFKLGRTRYHVRTAKGLIAVPVARVARL